MLKLNTITKLILTSFLILFTELVVIRWLSAYILYLSYFTNIILIASFFGIGLGALIDKKTKNLLSFFPVILMLLVAGVAYLKIDLQITSSDAIYFRATTRDLGFSLETLAPIIFILISSLFVPLGQLLGKLLNQLEPLKAYTWDIIGSLIGIGLFAILAFLSIGPLVWFTLIAIVYILIVPKKSQRIVSVVLFVSIVLMLLPLTKDTFWSPYYKLTLEPITYEDSDDHGWDLYANSGSHQTLELPQYKESIYQLPYDSVDTTTLNHILIIGAGGGTDTAVALERSNAAITAVEIDPRILEFGKKLNPAKPYANPRVTTVVNDGRAFLEQSTDQYDLIIFALTDSLTLASSYSNTRLESYLFTQESFEAAKQRLSDHGMVVLYNYYRQPWLIQKLGTMLTTVFNQQPFIASNEYSLAILMAGPGLENTTIPATTNVPLDQTFIPATDNWPFLYLKKQQMPIIYVGTLIVLLLITISSVVLLKQSFLTRAFQWHFFWLGAGFLLLETKNIINFSLLFGSTWLVNALVFFAILVAVLIANLITIKYTPKNLPLLYGILGILLLINLSVPLKSLLVFGTTGRYLLASLLTFTPIILANLIFAQSFHKTKEASNAFGANLLGAVFGGLFEYSSTIIGYHYLLIIIIIFYFFSWLHTRIFRTNTMLAQKPR